MWIILSPVARTSFLLDEISSWLAKAAVLMKKSTISYRAETEQCICPWWMKGWNRPLADGQPGLTPTSCFHILGSQAPSVLWTRYVLCISSTARTPRYDIINLQHHAISREYSQWPSSNKSLHLLSVFSCHALLFAAGKTLWSLDTFSVREMRSGPPEVHAYCCH